MIRLKDNDQDTFKTQCDQGLDGEELLKLLTGPVGKERRSLQVRNRSVLMILAEWQRTAQWLMLPVMDVVLRVCNEVTFYGLKVAV